MTHLLLPSPLLLLHCPSNSLLIPHARGRTRIRVPSAASNGSSSGEPSPVASEPRAPSTDATTPSPSPPPPSGAKTRLQARSLQARRQVQPDTPPATKKKTKKQDAARRERERGLPKQWDEMSLAEKAVELYVGEKGLLFWLNKSAYASIFIMVGAWILFRFVGPSLGLYQLDAPPLAPTDVLRG